MKSFLVLFTAAIACCLLVSCSRPAPSAPGADATHATVPNPAVTHTNARVVSSQYSQPISIDTANRMIASYVASINYPYQDTAVRSLSFDADTIRAYLSDSRISTLKFVLAHQLSYINGGSDRFGKNIGMKPGALTIICVGLDDNGNVVRNSSNGVYEHAAPCPVICGIETDAFLH